MEPDVKLWLAMAETDLSVAKHLFESFHPQPLEIICFHCQQSAEKAIKAVITYHGTPGGLPKKHDLSFLLNQIKNYVDIDECYYDYADALTPYGVAARYPNEMNLESRHAEAAIRFAGEILQWAETTTESKI